MVRIVSEAVKIAAQIDNGTLKTAAKTGIYLAAAVYWGKETYDSIS